MSNYASAKPAPMNAAPTKPGINAALGELQNLLTAVDQEVTTLASRTARFRLVQETPKADSKVQRAPMSDIESNIYVLIDKTNDLLANLIGVTDSFRD